MSAFQKIQLIEFDNYFGWYDTSGILARKLNRFELSGLIGSYETWKVHFLSGKTTRIGVKLLGDGFYSWTREDQRGPFDSVIELLNDTVYMDEVDFIVSPDGVKLDMILVSFHSNINDVNVVTEVGKPFFKDYLMVFSKRSRADELMSDAFLPLRNYEYGWNRHITICQDVWARRNSRVTFYDHLASIDVREFISKISDYILYTFGIKESITYNECISNTFVEIKVNCNQLGWATI
jgi:hypothetical protein